MCVFLFCLQAKYHWVRLSCHQATQRYNKVQESSRTAKRNGSKVIRSKRDLNCGRSSIKKFIAEITLLTNACSWRVRHTYYTAHITSLSIKRFTGTSFPHDGRYHSVEPFSGGKIVLAVEFTETQCLRINGMYVNGVKAWLSIALHCRHRILQNLPRRGFRGVGRADDHR